MKTQQQIIQLANTIKNEAENLPEENAFGEDNSDLIEEGYETARQLYLAAGGNSYESLEVKRWVNGDPSDLDAYDA